MLMPALAPSEGRGRKPSGSDGLAQEGGAFDMDHMDLNR